MPACLRKTFARGLQIFHQKLTAASFRVRDTDLTASNEEPAFVVSDRMSIGTELSLLRYRRRSSHVRVAASVKRKIHD